MQDIVLFFCLFLCVFMIYLDFRKRKFDLPPGPFGLPFIGYLLFLHRNPHLALAELCKKYGNVMSLYLGRTYAVVLADYESIQGVLSQTAAADKSLEQFYFVPNGIGFGDINGAKWLEQRRYTLRNLRDLGLGKSAWENEVHVEIEDFMNYLVKFNGKPANYERQLSANIGNNVVRLLIGYRVPLGHPKRKIIERAVDAIIKNFSKAGFIALMPKYAEFLKKIGFDTVNDEMLDALRALNRFIREEIENHKQRHGENCEEDYIDGYLEEIKIKEQKLNSTFDEEMLIGNIQGILFAGILTVKLSLSWLFLAMASYPDVQRKIHKEIDSLLSKDERPKWVEHTKFPYIFATIMEGQRWRTLTPLIPTHRTNAPIKIGEYVIPKDIEIMSLSWAVHNDPKKWPDPERFMPERFLTEENKIISNPDNYLPFSTGKRVCPGQNVAYIEIFCFFTSVMQKFKILPAAENRPPCLEGTPELFFRPDPQELRFIPRA